MTLDMLPVGQRARIVAVDWSRLVREEGQRLRALGIDEGAPVSIAHRGVFGGRDPLAITVGRATIAVRRVTVERKSGRFMLPTGEPVEMTDLPGAYGLDPTSPDEEVTSKGIRGQFAGEAEPDVLVVVLDASNLEQHLVFAQEVIALGSACRPSR